VDQTLIPMTMKMTAVNSLAEYTMSKEDIKYVACPTPGCQGNLTWISEDRIQCDKCLFQDELKKNEE